MKKTMRNRSIYLFTLLVITIGLYAAGGDLIVDGKIGIGTTTPSNQLNIRSANGGSHILGFFDTTAASADAFIAFAEGGTADWYVGNYGTAADQFMIYDVNDNTSRFIIDQDGKVGIGLLNPSERMDIKGKLRITHTNGTDYGLIFMDDVDKSLYINTANSEYQSIRFGTPSDYVGYIPKYQVTSGDWRTVIFTFGFTRKLSILSGDITLGHDSAKVSIGTNNAYSRLDVNGSVKVANDTDAASANKVGSLRYRVSGTTSYCEMCMQTGASTYAWVVVKSNTW